MDFIMARQVDEKERFLKRSEILDCAQKFVYTTGYEQMSIQDICVQLGISKGAFYHYFDSKPALLESLVDRTSQQAIELLVPIVEDTSLPAMEKLRKFFSAANQWKIARKEFFLELVKVWYADENAIVRQKLTDKSLGEFSKLLKQIIDQGISEKLFSPAFPEMTGLVILTLMIQMGESLIPEIITAYQSPDNRVEISLENMQVIISAFSDSIERTLGTTPGTIQLIDKQSLREWLPGASHNNNIVLQKEVQV